MLYLITMSKNKNLETEMRCRSCLRSESWYSQAATININPDGTVTKKVFPQRILVGRERRCFSRLQLFFNPFGLPRFLYPEENDTCIRPNWFKERG